MLTTLQRRRHSNSGLSQIMTPLAARGVRARAALAGLVLAGVTGLGLPWIVQLPQRIGLTIMLAIVGVAILMAVGNLRKLALLMLLIDLPLQLDTSLRYREDAAEYGALVGFNVSVTTLALGVLYGLWAVQHLLRRTEAPQPAFRASLAPGLYMVVVIVSTFVARDLELALFEVVLVLQMYLVFLYLASTTRTVEDVRFIAAALVLGLAVSGALMVNQRFSGWPGPHALFAIADNQTLAEESRDRVIGTMGSPNTAAAYLTLLLAPTACVWLTSSSRRFKLLAAVAFASGLLALLLSQSRGGLLALGISMGIVALVSLRRGWLPAKAPLIAICAVAILVAILPEGFFKRLAQDDSGSAQARWPLMLLALRMIADQSLLGVGANNFSTVMMQYVTPDFSAYGGEWLYTVHNKYLLVWAQTGLGGLITFIAVLIVALINGWRAWRLQDRFLSPLALGLGAGLVGHMVHMWVDVFAARPQIQTLWICSALLAGLAQVAQSAAREHTSFEAARVGSFQWRRYAHS